MAEAVVSFAAEKLSNLLIQKAVFLHSVEGEVEWVRDELKRMVCFLKDAAKKQSDSESIRNWISEIRGVAHDAEDAIEMFVLNVEGDRGLLQRFACFPGHMAHLNKVGKEIESIRERLKDIEDSRRRYDIQHLGDHQRVELGLQDEVEWRRRLDYWQDDKYVVGLKKDVELLLGKAILEKSEGLSVATISGMGGIGKSTLARKIYNHPSVVKMFECRVWAVVSSEFTPEDILKHILEQLIGSSEFLKFLKQLESFDNRLHRREKLKKELHQHLSGKRYFIVLDDVWESAHWESLSSAFPDADKGSRLLLTSRNQVLTKGGGYVHNMTVLDEKQSWELFLRKAFCNSTNGECPDELKNIGKEILKKCGGLPLAISVVGGLLAKKTRSTSGWGEVLEEMRNIDTISAILELSYQNLPTNLKACFLCLGLFKEDAIIEAEELVHIWVAQGLVPQEVLGNGKKMEDEARVYLNELISRNMVQVQEMVYFDRVVKSCHMHDLLHDLSIRKAKEEIDLEVVREEGNSHHQSLHKPRHRAIYFKRSSFIYNTNRNQYLRSLFIHGGGGKRKYIYGGPSSYWKSFDLLRVLHFGNAELDDLPEAIGLLIGLRYLKIVRIYQRRRNLRGRIFKQWFPPSWAKLKNLEVLDLRDCWIRIDKVIVEMVSLRHLYSDGCRSEVPLKKIRKLETLSWFALGDGDAWQIEGMAGVSKLGIDMTFMSDASRLNRYLAALENLVCLTLKDTSGRTINMEGLGALHRITHLELIYFRSMQRLPLPGDFPPSLSHLTLTRMGLSEDPMRVLERLPKLLHLKLRNAYHGEKMVVSRGGFPCLKVLSLEGMYELTNLEIEEGAMPELNQFIIRKCPMLDIVNLPEHVKSAMTDAAH